MRFPLAIVLSGVALGLGGCAEESPFSPETPDEPHPNPPFPTVYLADGAEKDRGWTTRTTWPGLLYGADNRPDAGGWHSSDKEARTGNHSWTFQDDETGRYHDQALFDLHLPPIDLADAKHPVLRFYYRGESESNSGDEFSWQGSAEGGTYEPLGGTDLPAVEWTEVMADLSGYAGGMVHLVLRFEADWCGYETMTTPICGPGSGHGYFVDDIEVTEDTGAVEAVET